VSKTIKEMIFIYKWHLLMMFDPFLFYRCAAKVIKGK